MVPPSVVSPRAPKPARYPPGGLVFNGLALPRTLEKHMQISTSFPTPFWTDFGSQHGPQRPPKPTPRAFQDALAAQLLLDTVSGPIFDRLLTPRNVKNHCFPNGFFEVFEKSSFSARDLKKHPKIPPRWTPKVAQGASRGFQIRRAKGPKAC